MSFTWKINEKLIKLPVEAAVGMFLIKEALKNQRFFNALGNLGCDCCYYKVNLSMLTNETEGGGNG